MQIVQIEEFKLSKKTRVGIIPFVHRFEVRILFYLLSLSRQLFHHEVYKFSQETSNKFIGDDLQKYRRISPFSSAALEGLSVVCLA